MAGRSIANKVIDSETRSELWFMAPQKLSESQILLLLQIYLHLGKKFPEHGKVFKVDAKDLGFITHQLARGGLAG
jgi:hypothetical protein